ncbi:hypothetical protein GBA52_005143 [Prunus armeniaca]|nr:hypothetical protein GBA52_005143 [Prunus armeniaca]
MYQIHTTQEKPRSQLPVNSEGAPPAPHKTSLSQPSPLSHHESCKPTRPHNHTKSEIQPRGWRWSSVKRNSSDTKANKTQQQTQRAIQRMK